MSLIVSQTPVNRLPAELVNNAAFVKQVDFDPVHQTAETGQPAEKIHGDALPRFDKVSISENGATHIYSDPAMSIEAGPDAPAWDPDAKIRVYYTPSPAGTTISPRSGHRTARWRIISLSCARMTLSSRPKPLSAAKGMTPTTRLQSFLSRGCASGSRRMTPNLLLRPLRRYAANMRGYWRPGGPLPCRK